MFELDNIKNIVAIAKAVLANNMLAYVKGMANNLYGVNNKDCGCGSLCGMRSLYQFIVQAEWRQVDMLNEDNYQLLINQIFRCMSLQPDYYKYTGGVNVINATIGSGSNDAVSGISWAEFNMVLKPPAGEFTLPLNQSDKNKLKSAVVTTILREGVGMQNEDDTRYDYYSFDPSTGDITIKSQSTGSEIFQVIYKRIVDGSSNIVTIDGKPAYVHFKYSDDGGLTFTGNNGNDPGSYIGVYTDFVETASMNVSDYTWSNLSGYSTFIADSLNDL